MRQWAILAVMAGLMATTPGQARVTEKLAALKPGAVVLFQGDSITEGGRWPGDDQNHIMGQDYAYMLAGEIGLTYPERHIAFLNRGVSGNTAIDLEKRWQADTLDLHPDVLSLMVGVNDTFYSSGETVDAYEAAYDSLIAQTLKQDPGIKIVLGESFILPVRSYAENYESKRADLKKRQDVAARLAAKYHLPLIPYQAVFDEAAKLAPADTWSWDGVHPTYAGHALMAEAWLKTVEEAWPQ